MPRNFKVQHHCNACNGIVYRSYISEWQEKIKGLFLKNYFNGTTFFIGGNFLHLDR